jgi:hypothetical protein
MKRRIGTAAVTLAALGLAACGSISAERPDALGGGRNPILIGSETITLKSLPLGRRHEGYTCGAERALVCTDNGLWSRCRCSQ